MDAQTVSIVFSMFFFFFLPKEQMAASLYSAMFEEEHISCHLLNILSRAVLRTS